MSAQDTITGDLGISQQDRSYAATIDNVYISTFEQNVRFLAQQMDSKLRDTVALRSVNSEFHNWDRIGSMEAVLKPAEISYTDNVAGATATESPVQVTPNTPAQWSRRTSVAATYNIGTSIQQEDPIQMLIDPQSALTREVAYGMRRQVDNIIIAAATGAAGTAGSVSSTSVFDPDQTINSQSGKITFDLITQVQQTFMDNTIDPNVPKVAVVSPSQVRALMQLTQQTSSDYVDTRALQTLNATGIVPNWMGFTWIVSTLLQGGGTGATAYTNCLFYTKDALGMQVNRDITVRIAEDPSISFAWRIYTYMTMGAVRIQDEQIVQLQVLD